MVLKCQKEKKLIIPEEMNNHQRFIFFWISKNRLNLFLLAIFLFSRTLNLRQFPLFEDEAAYIYFADLARENFFNHWSESFRLGLGPVFPNIAAITMRFIPDIVIAARLTSALLSILSFYSIGVIAEALLDKKASFFARVLYLILPFTFLYDRLAMLDGAAMSFTYFVIAFFIRFTQGYKYFWVGIFIGLYLAVLTKPTGFLAFALGPLVSVALVMQKQKSLKKLVYFLGVIGIVEITAIICILATISSSLDIFIPVYDRVVDTKTSIPLWLMRENAHKALVWIRQYSSSFLIWLSLIGAVFVCLRRRWSIPFFLLWGGIALIISIFVSKFWYPRYILPGTGVLILLASYALSFLWQIKKNLPFGKILVPVVITLFFWQMAKNDYLLVFNPEKAIMPAEDRVLYFELWTSGVFAGKAKEFFIERLKEEQNVTIFTDTMKILHAGITMELERENKNFSGKMLRELTFPAGSLPKEIKDSLKDRKKIYLVFTRYPSPPQEWGLKQEADYQTISGSALKIYSLSHEGK